MNERIIAHSPEILMTCLDQYYKKYCKWLQYAKHDYSLVISKQKTYCVIACLGYPKCSRTITIFKERDF